MRQPPRVLYLTALILALLPLTIGVGSTFLYFVIAWPILTVLGLLTIPGGVVSLTISGFLFNYYLRKARAQQLVPEAVLSRQRLVVVLIIFANFAAAVICAGAGIALISRVPVTVTIQNRSALPASQFQLMVPNGKIVNVGTILPGNSKHSRLFVSDGGKLTYSGIVNGQFVQGTAREWIDNDAIDRYPITIIVNADGTVDCGR